MMYVPPQMSWKSWSHLNTVVTPLPIEDRSRPDSTLAAIPMPSNPKKPTAVELRRSIGYLNLLVKNSPRLGAVLMGPPYNIPPLHVQQLMTIQDIQSLVRRIGSRGVHFDAPVAMDIIMLASRLSAWYHREREEV